MGFIVSWDQIREGMAKGGDGNFGSGITALPSQEPAGAVLHCPSFALLLTQPLT